MAEINLRGILEEEAAIFFDQETLEQMRSSRGRRGLRNENYEGIRRYIGHINLIFRNLGYLERRRLSLRAWHYLWTGI